MWTCCKCKDSGRKPQRTTSFFISNIFCPLPLTISWIGLQMLLRRCLINISIIIPRHFLYLLYLCPCLDLGLFMSYLCDLFFIFTFIFIMINRIISWIQIQFSFCLFLRICCSHIIFGWQGGWRVWIIFKYQKLSLRVLFSICLIFCQFEHDVAYKSVAYKKVCRPRQRN